jgi:hypothetical protein
VDVEAVPAGMRLYDPEVPPTCTDPMVQSAEELLTSSEDGVHVIVRRLERQGEQARDVVGNAVVDDCGSALASRPGGVRPRGGGCVPRGSRSLSLVLVIVATRASRLILTRK